MAKWFIPQAVRTRLYRLRGDLRARATPDHEARRANCYWHELSDYHITNDLTDHGLTRAQMVSDLVAALGLTSLLEIGCSGGRNLAIVHKDHPSVRLRGLDINTEAIEYARRRAPEVEFQVGDALRLIEPERSWDGVLTVSMMSYFPDAIAKRIAARLTDIAVRYVIAVEFWDGSPGYRRDLWYSRDYQDLFGLLGMTSIRWELSEGQYGTPHWLYVGQLDRSMKS